MVTVIAVLNALVAIPKIGDLVMQIVSGISAWYCAKQTGDTLRAISDACAFAARASNEEERYQAAERWRSALSRDRVS